MINKECLDYRKLNEKIAKDTYPLFRIYDSQVQVVKEDSEKIIFISPLGLY